MGGDLPGIVSRLDYLRDLGVNLIYLNPIFWSSSNHRYNTYDYYKIDPRLGTHADFKQLVDKTHANNIRIVIDGVFNHCGRGFYPFLDVMENGIHSSYKNWFHVKDFPVNAYGKHKFQGWQDRPLMPIFNLADPQCRQYLLDVALYWTAQGIDGWRLDAVGETTQLDFWEAFYALVKKHNPGAYLLAEIWGDGLSWMNKQCFDGMTNYQFRDLTLDFFIHRKIHAATFVKNIEKLLQHYAPNKTHAMCNMLGSHDTERIITLAKGDIKKLKLAIVFLFVYPGIPAIYYGDEIGIEGGHDPDNRRAMQWDCAHWNHGLRDFIKQMIKIRRSLNALRYGDWQTIACTNHKNTCAFMRRSSAQDFVLIIFNNGDQPASITLDLDNKIASSSGQFVELLGNGEYQYRANLLDVNNIAPHSAALLTPLLPDLMSNQ